MEILPTDIQDIIWRLKHEADFVGVRREINQIDYMLYQWRCRYVRLNGRTFDEALAIIMSDDNSILL